MEKNFPLVSLAIGKVSFFEILRERVLYLSLFVFVGLLGLSHFVSRLSIGSVERVIIDFGLSCVHLGTAILSVLIGAQLLNREFERRTAYVLLSKPITRFEFYVGKWVGLALMTAMNWVLMCLSFWLVAWLAGTALNLSTGSLAWSLVLVLAQAVLLGSLAMLFSTRSSTAVAAMFTFGVYLVGTNIPQVRLMAAKSDSWWFQCVLEGVAWLFPNLNLFQLGFKVTYDLPVSAAYGWSALAYAGVYTGLLLLAGGLLFFRREI